MQMIKHFWNRIASWTQKANKEKVILAGIILFSAGIRLKYFGLHRFHVDEALYASWAFRIYEKFDLLLNGASGVDKPPLLFYFQAISYAFFGVSENSARIPNFLAGIASVFLIFKTGRNYFSSRTGLLAAAFMAVSPMWIAYSNTAFTDPLLVFFGLASIWALSEERMFLSGVFWAMSFASKQFAVLYFGLVALIIVLPQLDQEQAMRKIFNSFVRFMQGALILVAALLAVTLFSNPSWGFILSPSREISYSQTTALDALFFWSRMFSKLFSSRTLAFLFCGATLFASVSIFLRSMPRRGKIINGALAAFIMGVLGFYIVSKAPYYSRYILLVAPFVFLTCASFLDYIIEFMLKVQIKTVRYAAIAVLAAMGLFMFSRTRNLEAWNMQEGAFYSLNDGIDQVGWQVKHRFEKQPVLFTHGAGWCYNFYCRDVQIAKRIDFNSPEDVLRGMQEHPASSWYLIWDGPETKEFLEILNQIKCRKEKISAISGGEDDSVHYLIYQLLK